MTADNATNSSGDYIIICRDVHKWFDDFYVLRGVSLNVERQEVIVIEVLDVMRELAHSGMTMIVVTHEMGFAREAADRIAFFDEGNIVEMNATDAFFDNPREERTKLFLSQILTH